MLTDWQIINSMFSNSCFIEESMDKSWSFEIKDFIKKKKKDLQFPNLYVC